MDAIATTTTAITSDEANKQMEKHQSENVRSLPRVMRLVEVVREIGLSRASIYRLVASGDFPQQFKIGSAAVGWLRAEVEAWVSERAALRSPNLSSAHQAEAA